MRVKNKKRIPLLLKVILIILLIALLFAAGMFVKMKYEQNKMNPLETSEVIPGVYAVKNGFVNFYILKGDDGYLMIDAGNDALQTSESLANLGISPEEIRAVLLTHSDADHVAALTLFPNAQKYLPEQEIQMIDGTTSRSPLGSNKLDIPYQPLQDGQNFALAGFSIQCIATPGHTPGSMSFLLNEKYLFVGDTLSLRDGKVSLFNSFYNMDDDLQKSSILTLAESTPCEFIFTGHYGYTDNPSFALNALK